MNLTESELKEFEDIFSDYSIEWEEKGLSIMLDNQYLKIPINRNLYSIRISTAKSICNLLFSDTSDNILSENDKSEIDKLIRTSSNHIINRLQYDYNIQILKSQYIVKNKWYSFHKFKWVDINEKAIIPNLYLNIKVCQK